MTFTHTEAWRLVRRLDLVGPCHGSVPGDYDRVRAAFERQPLLVPALNALEPGRLEETPQGAAAHLFCREILQFMLSRGVRLDLFMACALAMEDAVRTHLQQQPADANAQGAHGIHLLNHAADPSLLQLLLDRGANPNTIVYQPWGWTPMHEVAYRGRRQCLMLMVAAGGKLDSSPTGLAPLHAAARMGHRSVVEWLVQQGVNLHARDQGGPWRGKTALAIAEEHAHEEVTLILRQHGATE
jgi:ankyrin repeat protein